MQKNRHLCIVFLHKCRILVEVTGFECVTQHLNAFINKGLRYSFPAIPQYLIHTFSNVIKFLRIKPTKYPKPPLSTI